MVDIAPRDPLSSPPDRRLIAQLTQDPKLIRYLENLWVDIANIGPDNFAILLEMIINTAEVANAAQGTANSSREGIQSIEDVLAGLGPFQSNDGLQRKIEELECQLLEVRPTIFPAPTPPFAPTVITVTTTYAVPSAPAYQPATVRANAASAGFTVTLPASPSLLQLVNVKKIDASANVVTVSGGAINIDGGLTVGIGSQYTNLQVQFNGATWDVL